MRRRGSSARTIRAKLMAKGVEKNLIEQVINEEDDEKTPTESELEAAKTLAKRRRLGPFRPAEERAQNRLKDISTLARAGFSYDIIQEIIGGDDHFGNE